MTAAPPRRAHTVIDSPVGPITLLATGGVLSGLYLEERRHPPAPELFGEPDTGLFDTGPFAAAAGQLARYFAGTLTEFDLPLALAGTPFQQQVWAALRGVGYGETISYAELAARIGRSPAASRAVGLANGKNPVSIIVPCHRVVGSNGSLTGYGGGLPAKQYLIDFERARARG
jgi:methylated-DNA-[protein]-cysteine S-methyltransferase